jgi:hypothetical protein
MISTLSYRGDEENSKAREVSGGTEVEDHLEEEQLFNEIFFSLLIS